jgi:hypothetical protein
MDFADLAIEGAGFAVIIALMAGAFAIAYERRRLVLGVCLGLGVALLALPFIAYLVARLTNHHATDMDLTPPLYIVVTALVCGGLALLGVLGGALAEARRRPQPLPAAPVATDPDQDYRDEPTQWLPWHKTHGQTDG